VQTSRLIATIARWIAPSVVASCVGTIVAGTIDGAGIGGVVGAIAATGFLALLAIPILVAVSALVRGMWVAWRPRELAARLIDEGGAAPRLAAWALVVWLAAVVLA
jgi:hypothetical protein